MTVVFLIGVLVTVAQGLISHGVLVLAALF